MTADARRPAPAGAPARHGGREQGRGVSARPVAVRFEVREVDAVSAFWAALLGREVVVIDGEAVLPGGPTQVGLRFAPARTVKPDTNRLHLHVTSASADDQRRIAERVLQLGGRRRGTGALPIGRDLYVNDPGDDEFCIIAPGNGFLAGCGPLGEVTCEGTPAAGRFWRDALGWTTVWDQDGQLAIQSPLGGTKLSWDGASHADAPWWNRQRFVMTVPDLPAESVRLRRLGATSITEDEHARLMTDPDGTEFLLVAG